MSTLGYYVFILLGIFAGLASIALNLHRQKVAKEKIVYLVLICFVCVFVLGLKIKLDFAAKDYNFGFNSSSAIVGLAISVIVGILMYAKERNKILRATVFAAPLMYSIAKIACAIKGCCHGIAYSGIFAVKHGDELVFPVQATETIVFLVIYALGMMFLRKVKNTKIATSIMVFVSLLAKFLLDFLRAERSSILSKNQIIMVIFAIIWLTIMLSWSKIESIIDKLNRRKK